MVGLGLVPDMQGVLENITTALQECEVPAIMSGFGERQSNNAVFYVDRHLR